MSESNISEQYNLLDELINSFESVKLVEVDYVDVSEITKRIHKLSFDDVKKTIIYSKDFSACEVFKIQLPFIDEMSFIDFEVEDPLPPSASFIRLRSNVIQKPLGIVVVEIKSFETYINESDNRYLKDKLIFVEKAHFIYDFQENVYVQVNEKELNDVRYNLKKGLQIDQIKDEIIRDFLQREKKLNGSLGFLKELAAMFQKKILSGTKIQFNLENKTLIKKSLKLWKELVEDSEIWMYIKFIFSQISWYEVQLLKLKRYELLSLIDNCFKKLENLPEDLINYNSFSENYDDYKYINFVLQELEQTLYIRGSGDWGFFKIKNKTGMYFEIVENFKEIENRNTLSKDRYTTEDIEKEKSIILNHWNKKRR